MRFLSPNVRTSLPEELHMISDIPVERKEKTVKIGAKN
jgi:hypothetical protein